MSTTQCRHFVQNAWKKELCSNCFKSREEHANSQESVRPIVARTANGVKRIAHKVQGILRIKESSGIQVRSKRKNVAFPDSLTVIIGYDGGDEYGTDEDEHLDDASDDPDSLAGIDVDELPDSEEERALGNLTRANTNFNTVTANLTNAIDEAKTQTKILSTLMLGRTQKDSDGRKTTLLVSVKPFGGDDSVPTARRPSDKKSPEIIKPKPTIDTAETKTDLSPVKIVKKPVKEKISELTTTTTMTTMTKNDAPKTITNNNPSPSLGKIVDMPLITSTNFISVMREDMQISPEIAQKLTTTTTTIAEPKRTTSIARTPAIKKSENEKPRIVAQQNTDHNAAKNHKNLETSNGVELNLSPITTTNENIMEKSNFNKIAMEFTSYKNDFNSDKSQTTIADLTERKVEGEAASEKFTFEESRESAGEPDGKADEEVIAEPPALPKSPPPIDTNSSFMHCLDNEKQRNVAAEPRASFLHGLSENKQKPVVPQKPTMPSKIGVGSSLASLLSENRAYEFRMSQATRSNALMHSQSESQLCGGIDAAASKSRIGDQTIKIESYSHPQTETITFKGDSLKNNEKDEQTEDEPEIEDEEEDSEASSTEQSRSLSSKRRMAPQPPSTEETSASNLFARNPATNATASKSSDCPVVREKEKRERASSCSPKFRKAINEVPDPRVSRAPEPAPRRNISLSQDSLAAVSCEKVVEEKKKARSKFSLKKFLRMGSRKDVDMTSNSNGSRNDEIPSTPQPKPRLEIIHPLELDGAAVQVLRNDKSNGEDTTDSKSESQINNCQTVYGAQHVTTRPSKPPPPPRTQSLEDSSRQNSRPSPPGKQQQLNVSNGGKPLVGKSWQPSGGSSASDSIYANLGAIRSALAPAKPRRTSSMRDGNGNIVNPNNATSAIVNATAVVTSSSPVYVRIDQGVAGQQTRYCGMMERQRNQAEDSSISNESQISDYLSNSLIDEDSSLELRQGNGNHPISKRQSDSGALDSNSNEFKFQQSLFTRSTSLPYCASEAENELYSPFSCYHGDETSENSQDCKKDEESRIGRLRQRRGRSIVHRSLEDNYGAVIVANHEALAQFLEQTNQTPPVPAALRGLKCANLQFQDFVIERNSAVATGRRIFFSAVWNEQNVTLCVAFDPSVHGSRKDFYLVPIVEFIDTVPKEIVELGHLLGRKNLEATISVLPRLQVNTLKSFSESLLNDSGKEDHAMRESSFIFLQLVSALKSLQAQGIEEAPKGLTNVVLCREDKDAYHRLYLFKGLNIDGCESNEDECVSLCQCALNALEELNLAKKLPLIQELLMREKAVTLSQVKSILEFSLWGPADATFGGPRERETALQRWLDLERATVLHALVRARAQLTVTDEYQLLFLVRTSAKIMCEASLLLDRQRNGLLVRSN